MDEVAFGAISLRIAHHMQTAVLTAANTTSTLVWTAITTMWSRTGISAIYQDYKAAIQIRVGMSNPAKDITCLQTHFECLSANNAPISAYEQGMILLSAIPDEWDHVAAYYMQTYTSVVNMSFDVIRKAILAEFNRSGGSHPDQTHVTDKISAIKQKGKPPHFSKQKGANSSSETNDTGPSSSKKRRECCYDFSRFQRKPGQSFILSFTLLLILFEPLFRTLENESEVAVDYSVQSSAKEFYYLIYSFIPLARVIM